MTKQTRRVSDGSGMTYRNYTTSLTHNPEKSKANGTMAYTQTTWTEDNTTTLLDNHSRRRANHEGEAKAKAKAKVKDNPAELRLPRIIDGNTQAHTISKKKTYGDRLTGRAQQNPYRTAGTG